MTFLSQVQFSDDGDEALAQRIVKIYVGFFRACVKQVSRRSRATALQLIGERWVADLSSYQGVT